MTTNSHFRDENLNQQKVFLLVGGIFTFLSVFLMLCDIFIGSALGGDLSLLPKTALERFHQFESNTWLGLYNLDLLNLTNSIVVIPSFYALFIIHYHVNRTLSSFAFIIFLIGTVLFISSNVALPMYDLSERFLSTIDPIQKANYLAAGESLLVKGEHGSFGVFFGFFFTIAANILFSILMFNERVFSRTTSIFGLIGSLLLMIYLVLITFVPSVDKIALLIAAPGGILSIIWMIMYGIQLLRLMKVSIMSV